MRSFVPPVHFRREPTVEAALNAWTAPRLERAMEQLAETALNVRRTAGACAIRWRNARCSRSRCRRAQGAVIVRKRPSDR